MSKHIRHISTWAEKFIGINVSKLFTDIKNAKDSTEGSKTHQTYQKFDALLEEYYTQVDQVQEQLSELFKARQQTETQQSQKPIVVLIDELDRCDPGEAFEVIKQLRMLFGMSEIPIIFVLSANPDPIGLAIKHQYGLNTNGGEYEAKRILEKFVDSYIDMSAPTELGDYVKALWKDNQTSIDNLCVQKIDKFVEADIKAHKLKSAKALDTIKTSNPLYSNLRVLRKSLDYVCSTDFSVIYGNDFYRFHWTIWHLEILKQANEELGLKIRKIAYQLGKIARLSYLSLFEELRKVHKLSPPYDLNESIKLKSEKGNTAFSKYKSYFWEHAKEELGNQREKPFPQNEEIANILVDMLADIRTMDFIINLSLFPISNEEFQQPAFQQKDTNTDRLEPFYTYIHLLAVY